MSDHGLRYSTPARSKSRVLRVMTVRPRASAVPRSARRAGGLGLARAAMRRGGRRRDRGRRRSAKPVSILFSNHRVSFWAWSGSIRPLPRIPVLISMTVTTLMARSVTLCLATHCFTPGSPRRFCSSLTTLVSSRAHHTFAGRVSRPTGSISNPTSSSISNHSARSGGRVRQTLILGAGQQHERWAVVLGDHVARNPQTRSPAGRMLGRSLPSQSRPLRSAQRQSRPLALNAA